ncbi:MAG TPA: hypothetical protein VME67_24450 [Mycobacterium sp.]|nr:hypothetical protein [Mycobacterium sp.]HTX97701.1 hypothetical protein [Mycobacterium sp.]
MRTTETVVGAIGGLVTGYVVWLIAISVGNDVATVSVWSLVVLLISVVLAACTGLWGWWLRRRRKDSAAAFAFGLPVLPVALSLAVLTNLYL